MNVYFAYAGQKQTSHTKHFPSTPIQMAHVDLQVQQQIVQVCLQVQGFSSGCCGGQCF